MPTMYELTADYLSLLDLIDDPEVPADAIADTLEAIDGEIEIKADNVAKLLREVEGRVTAIKSEETRLAERRRRMTETGESIKKRLEDMMRATGKIKFKTDLFTFAIQKNGGKLPVIVDVDVSYLPDDLVIISEKPDTEAIRKLLDEGDTTYAHYGERGESLRIK